MPTLLIFSPASSPRLTYTLDLLIRELLHWQPQLTHDWAAFCQSPLPKLNYSAQELPPACNGVQLLPCGLLAASVIAPQPIKVTWEDGVPKLFQTHQTACQLGFDVLSSVFYMVTRYEEYLPFVPDAHGRFTAAQSLACQEQFLHLPVVHLWARILQKRLQHTFPALPTPPRHFAARASLDIDIAWAYLHRPWYRQVGALWRDVWAGDWATLQERIACWRGKQPDPYFTFPYLQTLHTRQQLPPLFFFLMGKFSRYDKNISPLNHSNCDLLKSIAAQYTVGIHPSYYATDTATKAHETTLLERIIGQKIRYSRQHFLRLQLPDTYHQLMEIGITHDFTMGYADAIGFRAGMAQPFHWFDLRRNVATDFTLVPFQVMDVTLRQYLSLSPTAAMAALEKIIATVAVYNGTFCYVWHNNSLSERHGWQGWRAVYEYMTDLIRIEYEKNA